MATSTNTGRSKPAATNGSQKRRPARSTTRARSTSSPTATRTATRSSAGRSTSTSESSATRVQQAQVLAERAVLVPVGAGLMARENVVAGVKGVASRYGTRAAMERELKRYERRGASARNRFERQVRRTRTKFERELRQRRTSLEREVSVVRRDFGKQTTTIGTRVEKLISEAQGRLRVS